MKNVHYINAGAGSGKTYTLTQTLVKLIKDGKCKPSEVILTTFTELAASEFRQKAYDALVTAECYEKAAGLDSATIGTVHSVALKYVQKYWYILGLSSRLNVLSEEDKKVFISEAVARSIEPEDRLVFKRFNEQFNKRGYRTDDSWVELIKDLLDKAETFGVDSLEKSREYSKNYIARFFTGDTVKIDTDALADWLEGYAQICVEGDKYGNPYAEHLEKIQRVSSDITSYYAMSEALGMMRSPKRAAARQLPGHDMLVAQLEAAMHSAAALGPISECIDTVFRLAIKVNDAYAEYKRSNGLIEYNDMEKYFITLLDNNLVKEDIRSSIRYVFVDEFQDSNPVQIEIFDRLSELVEKSYWVGDPKQSIYGFRGSAPEIVMELTQKIRQGGEGFSYENLPYSWRSSEELVRFGSAVAQKIFTDPERYPDPALKHAPKGNNSVVEHPLQHWNCVDGVEKNPATLPQQIIKILETTDLKPKDIAILSKSNENVKLFASYLRMYGLPVSSPEVDLASKAEIQLVFALLKFITMPDNHTKAELAMLIERVSLAEIITQKDAVLEHFDSFGLKELTDRVKHQSVPDVVDTVIDELDVRGLCASWGDAMNRNANLDMLQAQAREYDNHCIQLGIGSSLTGFITYVCALQLPPKGSNADNGVKVMTYHASKGLEWRMVILTDLKKDSLIQHYLRSRYIFNLNTDEVEGQTLLRFIPDFRPTENNSVPDFIAEDPVVKAGLAEYERVCREETKRLLYVGYTRAKDYLVTLSFPGEKFKWLSNCGLSPRENTKELPEGMVQMWGEGVPASYVTLVDGIDNEVYKADEDMYTWYRPTVKLTERPNRFVSPSRSPLEVSSEQEYVKKIAQPLMKEEVKDAVSAELGTCIHNCFALCRRDRDMTEECRRTISNHPDSQECIDPATVVRSYAELCAFLTEQYGPAVREEHELPFTHRMQNGQTVCGEMDLVWMMEGGHCVLVDYKNTLGHRDYAPQLALYRNALGSAGLTVDATLVFYALQGEVMSVKIMD